MARSFQSIVVAVFLCIVIFITGVSFPKYIGSQNLKKRTIFNSSIASLKLISKELLTSNQTGVGNLTNSNSLASKDEGTGSFTQSSFLHSIAHNRLQTPAKGKRFKRRTTSQDDSSEVLSWNFNLNVSRLESPYLHEGTKNDPATSDGKHLGLAFYAKSEGPRETAFSELQRTLDSVSSYLKKIFGSGSGYGTNDFEDRNKVKIKYPDKKYLGEELDIASMQNFNTSSTEKEIKQPETILENELTESFQEVEPVSELKDMQSLNSQDIDGENRNESLVKKRREGKIFFSIFELGGKLLGKTAPVLDTETTKNSVVVTQTERNTLQDENLPHDALHQKSEWITENSNREESFHPDSLESSVELSVKDLTNDHNTENLSFKQTTQPLECSDCITGGLEFPIFPNKVEENEDVLLKATDSIETLFTDEILEHFCKSLPNNLDGSNLSLLKNKEFKTEVMTDPLLNNIDEVTTEFSVQTDKRSFFSIFESGSGRSHIASDEKNLASFGQIDEFGKFPSVLDCLQFFNKKQNTETFPQPNDVNDSEDKDFPNFGNSSEAPNLEEQQLQFSSNLNSSVQTLDEIFRDTETDFMKSKTSVENESNFTIKDLPEKQEELKTESNNFDLDNKLSENPLISENPITDNGSENTSDDRRDGKFLSFFGFGSGSDLQENGSMSERFFNSFFASGARSLENSGGLGESDGTVDLGSGDSFLGIEGFSGDDTVLPVSDRSASEDFGTTSGQDHRFLSLLGFAGSGNGRELTENTELIVTELSDHIDKECSNNCSHSVTKQSHKCDYSECDLGNIHDLENIDSTESGTRIQFNESDCHDNCYTNTELLNDKSSISTSESGNNGEKNITGYFPEKFENCNCIHGNNFTGENGVFPGCDCSSDTLQESNMPYISPGSLSTETHLSKNLTGVKDEYEDCNDCNHDKFPEENRVPVTTPLLETLELTYQINTDETDTDQEIESPSHFNEINSTDFYFKTLSEESINTVESLYQEQDTTEMKPRRFVGTIFLTGSGDGGLFGDDGGPINLVEEARTINPIVHPRRRGRLDDLSIDPCDDCEDLSELMQEINLENPRTNQTANNFISSTTTKFDDNVITSMSRPKGETTLHASITNIESVTFRPVIVPNEPSSTSNAPPDLQSRPCLGARDCNVTLGERCITIDSSSVCDCGRTFVRQKLTGKCIAKRHVEATLKLPAEMFDPNLRNPQSERYKIMSEKSVDTMWLLLGETPDIQRIVTEVNVAKFTAGSLIISLNLVIAVENEYEAESIKGMKDELKKALGDEKLMKRASLNIINATVLSVTSELDPCKSAELNYCSVNAYCKRKGNKDGGYTCYCKEHFLDVSSDPLFPGEKCIEKCPPSYCGPNGHCEIIENERHCLCNGMYFGERCEVPGMVILCSLSITVIISLAVLFAVIIKVRCKNRGYGGSPTFRRNEEIGLHAVTTSRVSDAIALENPGAKVSKFAQIISTPLPSPPTIKVTHPTLHESSISFECDSSFDVTPMRSERAESTGS